MVKAIDVAKYITGAIPVDHLKLQKLLYYSQAVHLVLNDRPLFEEDIEAWMYGPVVPSVYHEYKCKGFEIISSSDVADIQLSPEEMKSVDMVLAYYGEMSGPELVNRTHDEDPWKNTYKHGVEHLKIEKDEIKKYFKEVLEFN